MSAVPVLSLLWLGSEGGARARRLQSYNVSEGLLSEGMGLYCYAYIQYYYGSMIRILTTGEARQECNRIE